jgi:hypothetical protein
MLIIVGIIVVHDLDGLHKRRILVILQKLGNRGRGNPFLQLPPIEALEKGLPFHLLEKLNPILRVLVQ